MESWKAGELRIEDSGLESWFLRSSISRLRDKMVGFGWF